MRFRPMPLLTVFALPSLIVLIWLGNWQYARFEHKMAMPEQRVAEAAAETVEAQIAVELGGTAQQVYGIMDGEPVWRRYLPARLSPGDQWALVLWDATGGPDPVPLPLDDIAAPRFERLANVFMRPVARGRFAPDDRPADATWYTFDADAMIAQFDVEADAPVPVVETIDVTVRNAADLSRARRTKNAYAYLEQRDPLPPQRHFGYALTWWGMAFGLIGVYVVFHHSVGRLRFRS